MSGIGDFINKKRIDKKMNITKLAEKSDISRPYLSQIESGNRKPSPEILMKISKGLGVGYYELMMVAGYIKQEEYDRILKRGFTNPPVDLKGNPMPEGYRLFDYEFIGHRSKKLKDSPVMIVYSFINISSDDIFYNCGIRSLIVLGNVDMGVKTATITILAENIERNEFFNAVTSSNANIDLKENSNGVAPFINAESYIHSISIDNKKRGLDFLSNLSDVLLKIIREKEETHLQGIAFKGNFHYFRKGTTKTISFKIDDSD